jgi:hypothetical protein
MTLLDRMDRCDTLFIYVPRLLADDVIEFRIDSRSGVAPYRQLVQQVRQALRLGLLHEVISCRR